MSEAIKEGKIDAIGLSNINIDDIKRASKVEKISAIQYEYSIARRELENGMLSVIDEIGASLVCWSPLANGILSGNVDNIPEGDFRNNNPKYQGENFQSNLEIIKSLKEIANDLGITTSQLALAWLINRGENIIPIPGSRKISRVDENLQALNIKLDDTTMKLIDKIAPIGAFKGQTLV
jgi:aryl-alcohol dehydrogenase-like predicted oxidoreductase